MRFLQTVPRYWSTIAAAILSVALISNASAGSKQLTCKPGNLVFSKVIVGKRRSLPVTITNTGSTAVTISKLASPAEFSVRHLSLPATLGAGKSIQFDVIFSPTAVGVVVENFVFSSNASNSRLYLPVHGTGVTNWSLAANPPKLVFGEVQVGLRTKLPVVLTNSGSSSITLSQGHMTSTAFQVSGIQLPLTLAAGKSFTFEVVFVPQKIGSGAGDLLLSSPSDPVLSILLSGTGTPSGPLTVAPATMNLGNVTVGNRGSQTGTLTASGSSVTVLSATSTSPEFTLSGLSLPATIAAGQSTAFTVTFAPQSTGAALAKLSFLSNASNSPTGEFLAATGIPPHSVSLSWTASTSPHVVGYNIYRCCTQGAYAKINPVLNVGTTYTDSFVDSGETYYYATTAVNSTGEESTYSNQVKVPIP
jgi:hypothetical protein